MDVSRATMERIKSQDPSQIMEGISIFASKSRDEISARFAALQETVGSYSKVDVTHHVVAHVVDSVRPQSLAVSINQGSNAFQEAFSGYAKFLTEMLPMERINEVLTSTFDVSAKLDQLKTIRIQDISPGKSIQDLAEFSDLSGAFETLKRHVASVLEPVAHAVTSLAQRTA